MGISSTNAVDIYSEAVTMAHSNNQIVGEDNNYYITIQQLEYLLNELTD